MKERTYFRILRFFETCESECREIRSDGWWSAMRPTVPKFIQSGVYACANPFINSAPVFGPCICRSAFAACIVVGSYIPKKSLTTDNYKRLRKLQSVL